MLLPETVLERVAKVLKAELDEYKEDNGEAEVLALQSFAYALAAEFYKDEHCAKVVNELHTLGEE